MKSFCCTFVACVLGICGALAVDAHAGDAAKLLAPDLVLHNGNILTVDAEGRVFDAVATLGDRIVALGSSEDILALAGRRTRVVDLKQRTVTPGFIDSHIHALGYGTHLTQHVMFSTGERLTVDEMVERIGAWARKTRKGEWIYARGPYSTDFVAEGRLPDRHEVDAVTPDNPFFMNMQGHVGVVNSYALRLAGIDKNTPDPSDGTYVRDRETGELTGIMYEFPAFHPFLKLMPAYSREQLSEAVETANARFLQYGITSVVNLWMTWDELAILRHLAREDALKVRWFTMIKADPRDFSGKTEREMEQRILGFGPPVGFGDEWLKINGIKIIFDGFAEAAWMHEPYMEDVFGEHWRGIALWDEQALKSVMRICARHDVQVSVHVAGDAAVDDVLAVMSEVDSEYPLAGRRWTLEHAGVVPSSGNIETVKRLGLVVSTQQAMGWSIGKTFKKNWGVRRGGMFAPNRTWLDAVGHPYVKAGSDNRPVNPFIGFWSYIAREDVDGVVSYPEEAISREDVLRLYTVNGAFGMFAEEELGTIEVGKLADMIVLSDDIMKVPVERIKDISPVFTIVGGKIMHEEHR